MSKRPIVKSFKFLPFAGKFCILSLRRCPSWVEQSGTFILPQCRITEGSRCDKCSSHQADHRRAGFTEEFCDGRILLSALPKESSPCGFRMHGKPCFH